jgi:hypothetical protein
MCHNGFMPTMTMRELRDTRKLKAWLRAGKTVELRDRNNVIGRIVPPKDAPPTAELPDFEARRKAIFGERVLNIVEEFLEDRDGPTWQPPAADKWPDFAARAEAILGDRIVPGADLLIEERERNRY